MSRTVILLLTVALGLLPGTFVLAADTYAGQLAAYLEGVFAARRAVFEQRYAVKFDQGWQPKVAIAPVSDTRRGFLAEYLQSSQSFVIFSPEFEEFAGTDARGFTGYNRDVKFKGKFDRRGGIVKVVDHELGHALADQVSRRYGFGPFPPHENVVEKSPHWWGVKMVSEGIAMWFESTSFPDWPAESRSYKLPTGPNDYFLWGLFFTDAYFHESAYWVTQPLLDHDVEKGLVYLVSHRLTLPDNNIRAAVATYHDVALKEMRDVTIVQTSAK